VATRVIKLLVTDDATAAVILPQLISGFEANPDWRTREVLVHFSGTIAWGLPNFGKSHAESLNTILSHLKVLIEDPVVGATCNA